MRRLIFRTLCVALLAAVAFSPAGCKRKRRAKIQVDEQNTGLATMVNVADPRTSVQLLRGFHEVENNAWRWTTHDFLVSLKPPAGAAQKGAVLALSFTVPPVLVEREKSVTVSAVVNGYATAPQTYDKVGEYVYRRDIPASVLGGEAAVAEFKVDKAMPPSAQDQRELALVVSKVGFEAK